MDSIGLILGYDSDSLRAMVMAALFNQREFVLSADADSPERFLELVDERRPRVVLLAIAPQVGFGHSFVEKLTRSFPECRVLLLGPSSESESVGFLLTTGAIGYVCQQSISTTLIAALRAVVGGLEFIDPAVKRTTSKRSSPYGTTTSDKNQKPKFLSLRETEVLKLLAQGCTNIEVAHRLSLGIKTAETYRVRLSRKLGLRTRAELFRYAAEQGMVSADQTDSRATDSPARLAGGASDHDSDWTKDTAELSLEQTHPNVNLQTGESTKSKANDVASSGQDSDDRAAQSG